MVSILSLLKSMHQIESQGMERGKEQGKLEGMQELQRHLIIQQITHKIGNIDPLLVKQIHILTTEEVVLLSEAHLDFSTIADLEQWLQNKPNSVEE